MRDQLAWNTKGIFEDSQETFGEACGSAYAWCGFRTGTAIEALTSLKGTVDAASLPAATNGGIVAHAWAGPAMSEVSGTYDTSGAYPIAQFASPWSSVASSISGTMTSLSVQTQATDPPYSPSTSYSPGDHVVYEHSVGVATYSLRYVCIAATTGNPPTDTTYWSIAASTCIIATTYRATIPAHVVETPHRYAIRVDFAADCHERLLGWLTYQAHVDLRIDALPRRPHTISVTGEGGIHYRGWIHEDEIAAADLV